MHVEREHEQLVPEDVAAVALAVQAAGGHAGVEVSRCEARSSGADGTRGGSRSAAPGRRCRRRQRSAPRAAARPGRAGGASSSNPWSARSSSARAPSRGEATAVSREVITATSLLDHDRLPVGDLEVEPHRVPAVGAVLRDRMARRPRRRWCARRSRYGSCSAGLHLDQERVAAVLHDGLGQVTVGQQQGLDGVAVDHAGVRSAADPERPAPALGHQRGLQAGQVRTVHRDQPALRPRARTRPCASDEPRRSG